MNKKKYLDSSIYISINFDEIELRYILYQNFQPLKSFEKRLYKKVNFVSASSGS